MGTAEEAPRSRMHSTPISGDGKPLFDEHFGRAMHWLSSLCLHGSQLPAREPLSLRKPSPGDGDVSRLNMVRLRSFQL